MNKQPGRDQHGNWAVRLWLLLPLLLMASYVAWLTRSSPEQNAADEALPAEALEWLGPREPSEVDVDLVTAEDVSIAPPELIEIAWPDSTIPDCRISPPRVYSGPRRDRRERAIIAGLRWLTKQQRSDGSWSFDAQTPSTSATSLALLSLLGAGQTHREGDYKRQVHAGVNYLAQRARQQRGDLSDEVDIAGLHSQSIATLALCEAYAMTNDQELKQAAQLALDALVRAQVADGSWLYRADGERVAMGWPLLALRAGHMAYLNVSPAAVKKTQEYLADLPRADRETSAPAEQLLSRVYLGDKHSNESLAAALTRIEERGPEPNDLQANYFASMIWRDADREAWRKWNGALDDQLLAAQTTHGPAAGSWNVSNDPAAPAGGRIVCTALAVIILEIRYQHRPSDQKPKRDDDFPL